MGLSRAAIRFLMREHRRAPLGPRLLTLGRLCVYVELPELRDICRREGVSPAQWPAEMPTTSNIPAWRGTKLEKNISDVCLFGTMGIPTVQALDYSDFEGAERIWDLNQPIPDDWAETYDTVLDSGTLEHVFDVRTALRNVNRILKPGGRIIHIGPCNNYANHGFYQFSPTWYLDYYGVNGYANIRVWVAEQTSRNFESSDWNLFPIDPRRQPVVMTSRRRLLVAAIAEKRADSTVDRIPSQAYYQSLWREEETGTSESAGEGIPTSWKRRIKNLVPLPVRHFVRTRLLGDDSVRPWGSPHRDRL
ncbi:MAG: methyltransferase [Pirellulaceae bacterium]|nr:methyltransferase [Pirellulaceae bacterium]